MNLYLKFLIVFIVLISLKSWSQTDLLLERQNNFISSCHYNRNIIEKPYNMDWVMEDVTVIENVVNKVPEYSKTLTQLKTLFPSLTSGNGNTRSITYNLDYELQTTQHTLYGSYGSINIDVLYSNDLVLKLRLTIDNYDNIIEEFFIDTLNLSFMCLNGVPTYELTNQDNLNQYDNDIQRVYIESNDSNLMRRNAINYFTDIYSTSTFNKPFYITFGLGSETFNHLRYFIVNKDYDALENLLYSPSPTGRLFVARTLFYLKEKYNYKPTPEINRRMDYIFLKSELIKSGIISCWTNKFDYDYFDIVKDYDKLLKTH